MMKLAFALAAGLVMCLAFEAPAQVVEFDRTGWVADLEQLKTSITQNSPNLEWAAQRRLDLPAVEQRARARIAAATNDTAARSALERFVKNFGDGHIDLTWPAAPAMGRPNSSAARSTCAELGYWGEPDSSAVASRLPGYRALAPLEGPVTAGVVSVAGRTVGVLRIPLFAPSDNICAAVLKERGMKPDAPCDDACADAVSRRADAVFVTGIDSRLRSLAAQRPDILLLDVAGNGGGNDTSIAIARMIAGADVPTPAMAFTRTSARVKDLEEDEAVLRAGLAQATPAEAVLLRRLLNGHADARRQAAKPCDLGPLWRGEVVGCSNIVRGPFYAGGLLSVDLLQASRSRPWAEMVSSTARFSYTPGLWSGPLLVLVDESSASSTELLAAMLQDAARAVVVGAPTFGAGCGWTLPKQDVVLRHSGGRLEMPDCARFRRDGRNEIDGVEPDVLVGFRRYDSPQQRVQRLAARLPAAIEAGLKKAPKKSAYFQMESAF